MCEHCGNTIETMCFKGSGFCSDTCRRLLEKWIRGEKSE